MSKKILTVLAPVAALIAFMVMPTMAQATTGKAGGVTISKGTSIQGSSSNLKLQTSAGTITCTSADQTGTMGTNPAETLENPINSESFSGCTGPLGSTMDVTANASAAAPWKQQVQQPIADGSFVVHRDPSPGSVLQITTQAQTFIGDIGTCDFSANTLQLTGTQASDVITVTGTNQYTLQFGPPSICGDGTATYEASYQMTVAGNPVTYHH